MLENLIEIMKNFSSWLPKNETIQPHKKYNTIFIKKNYNQCGGAISNYLVIPLHNANEKYLEDFGLRADL